MVLLSLAALVCGVLLIYWELCAPGRVMPGSLGALLFLAGTWNLALGGLNPLGFVWLTLLLPLFWMATGHQRSRTAAVAAVAVLTCALRSCFRVAMPWPAALTAACVLGTATLVLGRVARLGYRLKRDSGQACAAAPEISARIC